MKHIALNCLKIKQRAIQAISVFFRRLFLEPATYTKQMLRLASLLQNLDPDRSSDFLSPVYPLHCICCAFSQNSWCSSIQFIFVQLLELLNSISCRLYRHIIFYNGYRDFRLFLFYNYVLVHRPVIPLQANAAILESHTTAAAHSEPFSTTTESSCLFKFSISSVYPPLFEIKFVNSWTDSAKLKRFLAKYFS